jgi:3-hydroxybutyryl-CoA dehydrogenase
LTKVDLKHQLIKIKNTMKVGVLGAGTMGAGIAQVAAQSGHKVVLVDVNATQLSKAKSNMEKVLARLVEKGSIDRIETVLDQIQFSSEMEDFQGAGLVIEAIVEKIEIKHAVFKQLETIVDERCILASNTSSLSIASIGSVLNVNERIIGIHFFNPAPLMPLVEIIPSVQTSIEVIETAKRLIDSWGKVTVLCKDTPGFIAVSYTHLRAHETG